MHSLLGQFYTRIRGSQEDIASEGLTYILQRSSSARQALYRLIALDCGLQFDELKFITQNTGGQLERPDISGYNEDGIEVIILEAKFWASLTANQPVEYLNRLAENSALYFICPSLRTRTLYEELERRLRAAQLSYSTNHAFSNTINISNNRFIVIKTWDEILNTIRFQLIQDKDQTLVSDVDQIIGFCNIIDSISFQPIQNIELSPKHGKRINSFYYIVDKVTDELKRQGLANTNNLRPGAKRSAYTRYFKIKKFGVALSVNFTYWERYGDSPFWICLKDDTIGNNWLTTPQLVKSCKNAASKLNMNYYEFVGDKIIFALYPKLEATEDVVITDLVGQIVNLSNFLELQLNTEQVVK